jgi:hypothetical protein
MEEDEQVWGRLGLSFDLLANGPLSKLPSMQQLLLHGDNSIPSWRPRSMFTVQQRYIDKRDFAKIVKENDGKRTWISQIRPRPCSRLSVTLMVLLIIASSMADRSSLTSDCRSVCRDRVEILRTWNCQATVGEGKVAGLTNEESEELKRFHSENRIVVEAREMLKKTGLFLAEENNQAR